VQNVLFAGFTPQSKTESSLLKNEHHPQGDAHFLSLIPKVAMHASFNTAYTSGYNNGDTFSTYTEIGGYTLADISVGAAPSSNKFDVTLVVKNLLIKHHTEQAGQATSLTFIIAG